MDNIAIIDNRHPFTVAMELAIKSNHISVERQQEIKKVLYALVVDATSKFVGFANIESVRKGLDIVLGTLSFWLMHSTEGKQDFEVWSKLIATSDLQKAILDVVSVVRSEAALSCVVEENLGTIRTLTYVTARGELVKYATWRKDSKTDGPWLGYSKYLHDVSVNRGNKLSSDLATFLVGKLLKISVAQLRAIITQVYGDDEFVPLPDLVINNLIFCHCAGVKIKKDLILKKSDFVRIRNAYAKEKISWVSRAKKHYEGLVSEIPSELRPALYWDGIDWFKRLLRNGPPIPPKNWNNEVHLEGITGIYAYDIGGVPFG